MMQPLALVCCENLVLANQLVNRLTDLGYRSESLADAGQLAAQAAARRPFIIISDIAPRRSDVLGPLRSLRQDAALRHIPVLGVTTDPNPKSHTEALSAGVTLVALESGLLAQLPQLLEHALAVE